MSGHQPARLNGAPTPTAAINKKRLAEQVAFPLPSAKSSKRQRTDVPRPTIANVPSQRLVSTIENTPHTESTNSHLFPHNSSSEASPEPENLAVDWKGLLCKLFGADSNTNDETIVQALEQRMQLLQNAYAPVEESRSPSPVQVTPIYHVLHRTRCLRTRHAVVNCIDFDAPFVAEDGHLMSKNRIKNLDVHLAENPALSFIAFQDYRCCTELARRMKAEADPIPSKENIWLISSLLVDALRMAVKEFSHLVPSSMIEEKAEIENPHTWMYHLRDILPGKAADQKEETHAMHLSLFLSYFYDGKKNQFEQVNHLLSQGKITRQHFEYLFVPGTVVLENSDPRGLAFKRLYQIQEWPSVTYRWGRLQSNRRIMDQNQETMHATFEVKTLRWEFDGNFYKSETSRNIVCYAEDDEPMEIQKLPHVPMAYLSETDRHFIRDRGEKFWACRKTNYVSYFGRATGSNDVYFGTRFMVDIWNFRRAFPNSETARSNATSDLSEDDMRQEKPPGDEFVFLLPLSVYAFNFQDKNWRTLLVSNTGEVEWNEAAFDTVVLAEDTKTLVKALVMNMIEPGNATDIISGKGNGLVMLLHGGPGTGKTLTAERPGTLTLKTFAKISSSVAEYARKPLYRVTCGDIGTSPTAVEKHLKNVLMLGKSWDAVVLLDEAEVFLQERSLVDINRNALVSVFLRVLEYYDGILILTSNRVGIFDEGFKSRIQLAIHYDKLGLASRIQVWSNFIDRLATSQHGELDIDDLERHVNDLARYVLNGREIRNALTTGRQLARYEKKPLTYESLKHVIDVSSRFDKYLKDVNDGLDDDQLARDECLR